MKPRIHADELAASGGSAVAAAVGARSADHLVHVTAEGIAGARARRRRRDAAAVRGVLPEARPIRAGARSDRRRRAGRARDRRQSRRRFFAVDAVRDGARLLRDGPDVRRSAGRRHDQRRRTRWIGTIAIGSLEPGKQFDAVLVDGPAVNLLRVERDADSRGVQERTRRERRMLAE